MEWQGAWCDGSDEIVENIDLLNEWINVQRVEFGDTDIEGIQTDFVPFHMTYAFIKSFVFAFILATVPSFHGYYMKGGALEVGKASTKSFIWTSVCQNHFLSERLSTCPRPQTTWGKRPRLGLFISNSGNRFFCCQTFT